MSDIVSRGLLRVTHGLQKPPFFIQSLHIKNSFITNNLPCIAATNSFWPVRTEKIIKKEGVRGGGHIYTQTEREGRGPGGASANY